MQDSKNVILAIVLSIVIMGAWQYFYLEPKVREAQKQVALQKQKEIQKPAISADGAEKPAQPLVAQDVAQQKEAGRIKISTDRVHGSIALMGARLDDLTLAEYKITTDKDSGEVIVLSPSGTENVNFAETGWLAGSEGIVTPNAQSIWQTNDKTLTKDSPVTLFWDNGKGLKFIMKIAIDEHYMFTVTKTVENYGKEAATVIPYGLLNRTLHEDHKHSYILHEGALGALDNVLNEETFKNIKDEGKFSYRNTRGWVGLTDKYWLSAIIPGKGEVFDTNFSYFAVNKQDRYQVDYMGQKVDVLPGAKVEETDHIFVGAKKAMLLDDYAKSLDIPLFDRAVDFGRLYFITKPIFKLLTIYNNWIGNFGLAILMLTVTLKLLLFPLANKSYVSMHHLKRLQPQLVDLKERYKNDRVAMNKAVMELYKEEKVNPMAGCLPILLQIPIFFALYKVLYVTIEMRHAPFYGWINDLSAPDPTTMFNLFGLIPWNPPAVLMIGVWPIIMTITMILQQKMNPQPADPVQAQVMKILPFVFLFMFASFPAGLVIYWAWNNTLSILQQWIITRRLAKK